MANFKKISVAVLAGNKGFAEYLRQADIKQAKRGGTFVGNRSVAPNEFRRYGIVLPKGGMIIPDVSPEELRATLREVDEEDRQAKERLEAEIERKRTPFLAEVQGLYDLLKDNAGPAHALQALMFGDEPCPFGGGNNFEKAHRIGLSELLPGIDSDMIFEWTRKDINRLSEIIKEWYKATKDRRDKLFSLFRKNNGVFTTQEEKRVEYAGKSFGVALASRHSSHYSEGKWDEWTETTYYIGGEEVNDLEHQWLKSRSDELEVPEGFVRIDNDTNTLLPVPDVPGRNDTLVVVGKTDSRRGVWSYGEWFRGHPSKCKINFLHKGKNQDRESQWS